MTEWKKFEDFPDKIHFLTDGECLYLRGDKENPILIHLTGNPKYFSEMEFTHVMELPELPYVIE